jgi:hypothetical protein
MHPVIGCRIRPAWSSVIFSRTGSGPIWVPDLCPFRVLDCRSAFWIAPLMSLAPNSPLHFSRFLKNHFPVNLSRSKSHSQNVSNSNIFWQMFYNQKVRRKIWVNTVFLLFWLFSRTDTILSIWAWLRPPSSHETQPSSLLLRNPECREWRSTWGNHRGAAPTSQLSVYYNTIHVACNQYAIMPGINVRPLALNLNSTLDRHFYLLEGFRREAFTYTK